MTLPADLILTEANVTFPTHIALDGTETFTLTINNTLTKIFILSFN